MRVISIGEKESHDPITDLTKTVVPFLFPAMTEIFGYNTIGIGEGILTNLKWDSMSFLEP